MSNHIQSNFAYLRQHDDQLARLGLLAEQYFPTDPNTTLLKLRQLTELLARQLAARAGILSGPEEQQSELLRRLQDYGVLPREIYQLFNEVRYAGNKANHALYSEQRAALNALKITWQIGLWFHRTFANAHFKSGPFIPPAPPIDPSAELQTELARLRHELDSQQAHQHQSHQQLTDFEAQLRAAKESSEFWEKFAAESEQRLNTLQSTAAAQPKATLVKVANAATKAASHLQLDETATREIIDQQLRDAGWEADSQRIRYGNGTRPQRGRNLAIAEWPAGSGPADYVLFVGMTPLAVIEAKRKNVDVSSSLQQAKRYSRDILASHFEHPAVPWGDFRIPFAFATNGRPYLRQLETRSGIWFCDLRRPENLARALESWYTPAGLTALFKRDEDAAQARLATDTFQYGFPLRHYQKRAIVEIESQIGQGNRRMLLAMATGTGKTKTAIALIYRLLKAQRFRRILFLVDRSALGEQAANAFKDTRLENLQTFAEIFGIKELDDATPDSDTATHIATIQGMVRRILYTPDGQTPPPIDQYDCIVVDECHRGYLLDRELSAAELTFRDYDDYISKYRRVLDYFDAVKIGLTATPALHTTEIFGPPLTASYSYREAVIDGYLVDYEPPFQIKTALSAEGIRWRTGEEVKVYDPSNPQTPIVSLTAPDEINIEVEGFNRKVITEPFNEVVCAALAREIDPSSRLKTLIFCVNDAHADLVVKLLKAAFAHQYGSVEDDAVVKITGAASSPLKLIRRFKNEHLPSVAVTVDLLTTGIDVPEIGNLVFLRRVNSRILFDQMLGRGTRLCDELGKETFRVFDAVLLFEALELLTAMQPVVVNPKISFSQLAQELARLTDPEARHQVLDQFVAKLQRKKRHLDETATQDLEALTGLAPAALIDHIRELPPEALPAFFAQHPGLGDILDRRPPGQAAPIYFSEHPDELRSIERGYGAAQRPEDYLEAFRAFVRDQRDLIPALNAVLTRPRDLTRKQLRELLLALREAGFTEANLDTAWRETTNQDIAARIVGYIRQAASGEPLVPYNERVDHALQLTLAQHPFTGPQREWLKRIAAQTKANLLVDREALDDPDLIFRREGGGFARLDRIFDGHLQSVLESFNEFVLRAAA